MPKCLHWLTQTHLLPTQTRIRAHQALQDHHRVEAVRHLNKAELPGKDVPEAVPVKLPQKEKLECVFT